MRETSLKIAAIALLISFVSIIEVRSEMVERQNGYFKVTGQQADKMSFGDIKFTIFRDGLFIPQDFGSLVTILPVEGGSVFWFQDSHSQIRNVVILGKTPLSIQRKGLLLSGSNGESDTDKAVEAKVGYFKVIGQQRETLDYNTLKVDTYRDVFYIPQDIGRLIRITSVPGATHNETLFWFQNEDGTIRDVMIPIENFSLIQRKGTLRVEFKNYIYPGAFDPPKK